MNGYQQNFPDRQYAASPQQFRAPSRPGYHEQDGRSTPRAAQPPMPMQPPQQGRGYDQYQNDAYTYNQQYQPSNQNGSHNEYGQDGYYGGQNQQGYYQNEPIQHNPPRQHHYDERFHNDGGRGAPQSAGGGRQNGSMSPTRSRPGTSASNHKSKPKRERILDADFYAPKVQAWDNPFGVFPGSKKGVEAKKKEDEKARAKASTPSQAPTAGSQKSSPSSIPQQTPNDIQRPHTSHGSGRSVQSPQNSMRNYDSPISPLNDLDQQRSMSRNGSGHRPSPMDQAPPMPHLQNESALRGLPSQAGRGLPSQTEHRPSAPLEYEPRRRRGYNDASNERQASNDEYQQSQMQQQQPQHGSQRPDQSWPDQISSPHTHTPMPTSRDQVLLPPNPMFEQRRPSDPSWNRERPEQALRNAEDMSSYRGVPIAQPRSPVHETPLPNFAAIAHGKTEDIEAAVTMSTRPTAYTKQAYQTTQASNSRSVAAVTDGLAGFTFDLPNSASTQYDRNISGRMNGPFDPGQYAEEYPRSPDSYKGHDLPSRVGERDFTNSNGQMPPRNDSAQFKQPMRVDTNMSMRDGHSQDPSQYRPPPRTNTGMSSRDAYSAGLREQPPFHPPSRTGTDVSARNDYHPNQDTSQFQDPRRVDTMKSVNAMHDPMEQQPHYDNGYGYEAQGQYSGYDDYDQDQYPPDDYGQYSQHHQYPPQGHSHANGHGPPHRAETFNSPQDAYAAGNQPMDMRAPPPRPAFHDPYASQSIDQVPPRPRTAPGTRPPQQPLPMPSGPGGALVGSDAAHPVPFRPGLAPPPAPTPVQPPSQSQQQRVGQAAPVSGQDLPVVRPKKNRPKAVKEPVVTIAELNNLRDMFRNNPNNHGLGLKLAKRLLEAAKVLADEGGRADAKRTAYNRERYTLDAHKIVKKLVSADSAEAMFYLADCYGQGQFGLEPDPKEAYNLYNSAAKLGHAQAAYRVAVCCELGQQGGGGTKRDHLKAISFYKRAATLQDPPAMYKMGMIMLKGLLGQQPNTREAVTWLKRAADRADEANPHALHQLGLLYESAKPQDFIIRDENYARQLFYQAAELGYQYSQFKLGSAFEYGLLGCPISARDSIAWYTMAAKQGEHQSEFALSGWYLTGSPPLLEQSDQEAYLWARKAASSGLAKAEYAMGHYTEVGIGVAPDMEEAKRWYYRAAAQNHPKAKERLEDLKRGGPKMQKTRISRSNIGRQNEGECTVM